MHDPAVHHRLLSELRVLPLPAPPPPPPPIPPPPKPLPPPPTPPLKVNPSWYSTAAARSVSSWPPVRARAHSPQPLLSATHALCVQTLEPFSTSACLHRRHRRHCSATEDTNTTTVYTYINSTVFMDPGTAAAYNFEADMFGEPSVASPNLSCCLCMPLSHRLWSAALRCT